MGGPTVYVGLLTMVAAVQVGSLFSSDSWNNVTFTAGRDQGSEAEYSFVASDWNGRCVVVVCVLQLRLSERAADGG